MRHELPVQLIPSYLSDERSLGYINYLLLPLYVQLSISTAFAKISRIKHGVVLVVAFAAVAAVIAMGRHRYLAHSLTVE
jgi:hypothetical protein